MLRKIWICLSLLTMTLAGGTASLAQEEPRNDQPSSREALENRARAILQIKSEAGVCYWRISGDDDLVRLPVQDERFQAILLSARFDGDQMHLMLAGENAPLDTSALGQFDFNVSAESSSPVTVNSFRAVKAREGGWELRALSPHTKVDTLNCCSCGIVFAQLQKLSCCPNKNYCIGCGACGTCCG